MTNSIESYLYSLASKEIELIFEWFKRYFSCNPQCSNRVSMIDAILNPDFYGDIEDLQCFMNEVVKF
jgi:hypothetical protein